MKVYIDTSCDIQYSSYYIYGLYQIYGKKNVSFSSSHFKGFKHNNHFFSFVIEDSSGFKKVVVDFTDSSLINPKALEWCDVYGKINLDATYDIPAKVMPIGPSFGIQIYNLPETLWFALTNLIKSYRRIPKKRKFLSDYKAQFKRPRLSDYKHQPSSNSYVFFMASLWKQEPATNQYRANFIEACKEHQSIAFEGGFAPRTKNDIQGFESLTQTTRIGMKNYLKKTKDSSLVFNTPAVKACHGWKLAEYLCLGKAIISTPISRALPSSFKDETHFLSTDGTQKDISTKINQILSNTLLRKQLEKHAKIYYDTFLSPVNVIKRLLS